MADGDRTPTGGKSSQQPPGSRQGSTYGAETPTTAAESARRRIPSAAPTTSYGNVTAYPLRVLQAHGIIALTTVQAPSPLRSTGAYRA